MSVLTPCSTMPEQSQWTSWPTMVVIHKINTVLIPSACLRIHQQGGRVGQAWVARRASNLRKCPGPSSRVQVWTETEEQVSNKGKSVGPSSKASAGSQSSHRAGSGRPSMGDVWAGNQSVPSSKESPPAGKNPSHRAGPGQSKQASTSREDKSIHPAGTR
jgi:hypothetical protein